MTCPHCGSAVSLAQDAFCLVCREPLDEPAFLEPTPAQQAARRTEGRRNVWFVLVGILVLGKLAYILMSLIGTRF